MFYFRCGALDRFRQPAARCARLIVLSMPVKIVAFSAQINWGREGGEALVVRDY